MSVSTALPRLPIVLVTGSRKWTDYEFVLKRLARIHNSAGPCELVHGGARGLDTIAGRVASLMGWRVVQMDARWDEEGIAAGKNRNVRMLDRPTPPDVVIAFATPTIAASRGTRHCALEAHKRAIPLEINQAQAPMQRFYWPSSSPVHV